jgi:hypothetical protein
MKERITGIYNALFTQVCSKEYLSKQFEVSIKTIENTIKKDDNIIYSKKLGGYHFDNLLPSQISYHHYFYLFQDNLSNPILKRDMLTITSHFNSDAENMMIDTGILSDLSKKIIQLNTAINHNCVVKIAYRGNNKPKEDKYIQAHQILTVGSIYYLYISYDKRNKVDIYQKRQLAFNSIESLEVVEYKKEESFRSNEAINSFGSYENASTITLRLHGSVAYFFKREGFFEKQNYKFLSEDSNNSIEMQMVYNNKIEVIKLVQEWMPQIQILNNSEESEAIRNEIRENYKAFIED